MIRSVYLNPDRLSQNETQNLMRLCAVEELELALPEDALANRRIGFHQCNRHHGIVFRQTAGKSAQYIRYRLAHAALGQLILRSAHDHVNPVGERRAVALQHPFSGSVIVARLAAIGRLQEASDLISEILQYPLLLLDLGSLSYTHTTLRRIQTLGIPLPSRLGETLTSPNERNRLIEGALQTPLHYLASFLGYAAKTPQLEPIFKALADDLAKSENHKPLLERALKTPLGDLASFLSYAAKTVQLEPIFKALADDLARPEHRKPLLERALQTPLDGLSAFLSYADKTMQLEPIFKALADDLARPENRKPLLERALQTPLHFLANFLGYAAKTTQLEPISKALADDLARPEHRKPLLERALQTPLGGLSAFLSYAAKTAQLEPIFKALVDDLTRPENRKPLLERALQTQLGNLAAFLSYTAKTVQLEQIFKALADDLARPENRKPLLERALQTQLGNLAAFLSYAAKTVQLEQIFKALADDLARPENRRELATAMARLPLDALVGILTSETLADLWNSIFVEVDAIDFGKAMHIGGNLRMGAFVPFQRIAHQQGRPELAEAIARRLISESTRDDWAQPGIALHHLSHVLWNARGISPTEVECFLDSIATPEFVNSCINSVSPGGLAGCLLALANTLEPGRRKWFQRESLARRVAHELSLGQMYDAESRAEGLALLGAAASIGTTVLIRGIDWLTSREIAEVLDLRAPDPDRTTIGPLQVQLWLGLREIARVSPNPLIVSPLLADPILRLWLATQENENADSLPPHVRDLNAAMIAWLQQCKAAGWQLVRPEELP
jgi:hypothetical protein